VDAGICREHLERLLAEEAASLTRLETLLDQEHELLLTNQIDALDRTGQARQQCVGDLMRIEDERRSLCRMMNLPADLSGLERLMRWCDPTHSLPSRWADCAERATRCRCLNDRNGALVTARLKNIEGLLGVLTGRTGEPKVYGRQGVFATPLRDSRVQVSV